MIELASADVSAVIQEKEFTNDTPVAEKDRYVKDGMSCENAKSLDTQLKQLLLLSKNFNNVLVP